MARSVARHSNCVFPSNSCSLQKRRHWLCSVTVSSPATLVVSRNVAIDCVQLQIRVHSAQQRSRALLARLVCFFQKKWQYRLPVSTIEPIFPPAPKLAHCVDQSDCSLHLQQHQHCNLIGPNSVTVWRRREKCWRCCTCRLQSDWSKQCDSFGAGGKMGSTALRYYEQTIYCHFLEEAD